MLVKTSGGHSGTKVLLYIFISLQVFILMPLLLLYNYYWYYYAIIIIMTLILG